GNSFGADPFPILGLVEAFHYTLPLVGPLARRHAVNQQTVNVICVEGLAMLVDGRQHIRRLAGNLGLKKELFAGQTLDGFADPIERRILLCSVQVRDALVIGVTDKLDESFLAQYCLVPAAVAARANAQTAELDTGLAEHHLVDSCALDSFGCRRA